MYTVNADQIKYKMQEMMREAEHERLVHQAQVGEASPLLLSPVANLLGRQLIRLGTLLARTPQPAVRQPEMIECACTA